MATEQSIVDFIIDQLQPLPVSSRKMFGEYTLYFDNKVVAFICDDQLFMKITEISNNFLDSSYEAPAYPGSKPYLNVPEERWEHREWMRDFIQQTANVLPIPKPKKVKS
jgi:DNA transformation protein